MAVKYVYKYVYKFVCCETIINNFPLKLLVIVDMAAGNISNMEIITKLAQKTAKL